MSETTSDVAVTTFTDEELGRVDAAVALLDDEATEFVDLLGRDPIPTTKDNYGRVMSLLSKLSKGAGAQYSAVFLIALVRAGYPAGTAKQLVNIMGWPSTVAALIEREATR